MGFTRSLTRRLAADCDIAGRSVIPIQILSLLSSLSPLFALSVSMSDSDTQGNSTSLNVDVQAGSFIDSTGAIVAYAGVTGQAITASTTKYLYLSDAGVLVIGTAWPAAATKHVRLAVVVAGTSTITSVTDSRITTTSCG